MHLSPDDVCLWQYGFVKLNLTIVTTWALMLALGAGSWLVTRKLTTDIHISRWQCLVEMIVVTIRKQIAEVGLKRPDKQMVYPGTIFLFIAFANLCTIIPGYEPPTASLSTTAALALSVFVSVPFFGIADHGLLGYIKTYLHPTFIMLPFNIISELSRTLALAVRLFGNMMSGTMILGILLTIAPFIFPVIMSLFGLLTGMVQAYIFSILTTVFIAAAMRENQPPPKNGVPKGSTNSQKDYMHNGQISTL